MKIAILFSGRIDRFREHRPNLLSHVIQDHDADVFLSHSPELPGDVDEFVRMYQPKKVVNEPITYGDFSQYHCHPQSNSHNMMCMWINRARVFRALKEYMAETNTWYDLVISTRLDLYSDEHLNYAVLSPLTDSDVYIPQGHDWGGLNDQCAIGTFYAMETYMMLYDTIYPILDDMREVGMPTYGPEPVLLMHLARQGIRAQRFPYAYRLINGKFYKSHTDRIVHF